MAMGLESGEGKRLDVYGVGQCALDHLGRIPAWPPPDQKTEFRDLTIQGGGPVATALTALSRWGLSVAFAGVVGDDAIGLAIRASLDAEGVDTADLVARPGGVSQFAFIAAEPDGRRNIFFRRPTGPPPTEAELDLDRIRACRALHADGFFPGTSLAACREAKAAGALVSLDAGTLRGGMLEIASLADVVIASSVFARALLGRDDPREACRRIAALGPELAGVTRGAAGYVALSGDRWIEGEAWPVDAVDTTGCGDVFHAGFLFGALRGWPAEKSLDFAAWAAAQVATRLGGRAGIPPAGDYPGPR